MSNFYDSNAQAYISVDCIIFGFDSGQLNLLIGHRKMDPGRGEWSLYGGFVTPDESLDEASQRVLKDLTGMKNTYMCQVGAYGAVNRDPGSRVVSVAYCALINVNDYDEDLRREYNLEWVPIDCIPTLYSDHREMVDDALKMLRRRITYEPLCFSLLPDLFTLTQLQNVHEAVLGHNLDKRNFRKRIKGIDNIIMTDMIDKVSSKRGASLYRFDKNVADYHF